MAGADGRGVWAIAVASVLWGTTGTASRLMPAAVSPLAIGAATMGLGGALLFLVTLPAALGVLRSAPARRWALLGGLGVLGYPLAFYTGMAWAGVAIGNVVALGTGPVFAAILERMLEGTRLGRRWGLSTGIAVAGVAVIAFAGSADGAAAHPLAGIGCALLAGLCYAFYTCCSARALRASGSSAGAMGAMFGVGAVLLAPVLLALGGPILASGRGVAVAGYLAVGPTCLAYLLFGRALRSVRPATATTIALLEPLVACLLAVTVVGERLAAIGWLGVALVLAGVILVATPRRAVAEQAAS
ncbi:MAG: EamA family transporter [Microbacteriaceae bacterium]